MMQLPDDASHRVARIEAMLDEAAALLKSGRATDEASFSLSETRARYLPDTLRAYFDVPPSLRQEKDQTGRSPDERLVAQLEHLERAVAQRLRELAEARTNAVAANETFLAERFGPAEALPAADDVLPAGPAVTSTPASLMRAYFDPFVSQTVTQPTALIAATADRFKALVPQLVGMQRGMLGMGAIEAVWIDVPVGDGALRYTLSAQRSGIEAVVTKIVRGVALRSQRTDLETWLQGLYADLGAYVAHDRATRDTLNRFLEH
jgi:hypothetical protein